MEKLKQELSRIGTIEVIKDEYVFTLLMTMSDVGQKLMKVLSLIEIHIKDKKRVETLKNTEQYLLVVLKP